MDKKVVYILGSVVALIALVIYWLTAYQTITWWDNSSYPIAAYCFGVEGPPGSLLLTILGWIVLKISSTNPQVFALNLFAGILGVGTLLQLFYSVVYLTKKTESTISNLSLLGISLGLLTFAFSETFWTYAIQFTPYMLTCLMTAILLHQLFRFWFEENQDKAILILLLISFLIGLDFSIHRTNSLLIPGLVGIILMKDIKLFLKIRLWLYGVVGLVLGLSIHFLKIPIALSKPILNFNNPDTLSRFYDYVSLKQYGGGFLSDIFTRKAPIVSVQTMDYINSIRDNFLSIESPLSFISVLSSLIVLLGIYFLYKRSKKTVFMLLMLFVITTSMTIFYFNIPENFFRSLSRHYLPSFIIFAIFLCYGFGSIFSYILKKSFISKALVLIVLLFLPLNQIFRNYTTLDGSKQSYAADYADNILNSLEPNAIIFVFGDVYYPLFYMQQVEGKRTDVDIVSVSLCNTTWYVKQLTSNHYNIPLTMSDEEITNLSAVAWADTTIEIAFEGNIDSYRLQSTDSIDTVPIQIAPTVYDKYIMAQDKIILQILQENKWQRPVYFTQPLSWLQTNARPEGLVSLIVPKSPAEPNIEILKRNLIERYSYNGYKELNSPLEFSSMRIGETIWNQFIILALTQQASGDEEGAKESMMFIKDKIPLERLHLSEKSLEKFESVLIHFE